VDACGVFSGCFWGCNFCLRIFPGFVILDV
jgi:radical SAM superfamily enzyme YgiQ (UPF0313 family)